MDVGRAARRRPQRHAAVPDRPGPASRHPRPDADRDPATTAPGRARPAHLARPRSDPATTTRPAEPAGRPGPAAGTPRTHLTAQPYPNEQGPGDTDPDVGCFCTPTPTRTMQRQRSRRPEQDHSASCGSRSDRRRVGASGRSGGGDRHPSAVTLRLPAYEDGSVRCYLGSVLDVLAEMPDESVQCVVTSPPYWGLRDYG